MVTQLSVRRKIIVYAIIIIIYVTFYKREITISGSEFIIIIFFTKRKILDYKYPAYTIMALLIYPAIFCYSLWRHVSIIFSAMKYKNFVSLRLWRREIITLVYTNTT